MNIYSSSFTAFFAAVFLFALGFAFFDAGLSVTAGCEVAAGCTGICFAAATTCVPAGFSTFGFIIFGAWFSRVVALTATGTVAASGLGLPQSFFVSQLGSRSISN